jgi:hypothetical protein
MIGSFIKKLIRQVLEEQSRPTVEIERAVHNHLTDSAPSIMAYRINNGYIVRVYEPDHILKSQRSVAPNFTYCKDAQAIAEHIVASAMKDKLGVQSDMFERERQAASLHHPSFSLQPGAVNRVTSSI